MKSFIPPFGRFQNLHQVLMVSGVFLTALVVTILAGSIVWLRDRALHDAEIRMSQLNVVVAEQVERALESVDGVTQVTVSRIAQTDLDDPRARGAIHVYLNQQAFNLPQARSFLVLDRDGNRIVDSQYPTPLPQNNSDGEGFRHFRDNPPGTDAHLSAPMKSRQTGEWFFSLSRPLDPPKGEFAGVAIASIDLSYFTDVFKSIALGKTASVSFARLDGIHLFRYPSIESASGRSVADGTTDMQHLSQTHAGVIREAAPLTGEERLVSFRTLKGYPVVILLGLSVDEILASWRVQAWAIGAFGAGAVMAIVLIGLVLIRLARREDMLLGESQQARHSAELATKAAERASRAKSEFLASVSHDLRTPLNSIIGFSEVMLDGLSGVLSEKAREYVGFIHTSGQHLLSLINNLLDLAKVEANRLTILDDEFSLHSVASECLRLVSAQANAGRVNLVPCAGKDIGLRADPVRVRQILFNLLSNAIKFTPPGGTVGVLCAKAEDGSLHLSVSDTGIGMTRNELDAAMQPYGQVMNAFTREREGTGLGLPLVKALAELHGGRLDLTSAPKQGTKATVIFPPERVLPRKDADEHAA